MELSTAAKRRRLTIQQNHHLDVDASIPSPLSSSGSVSKSSTPLPKEATPFSGVDGYLRDARDIDGLQPVDAVHRIVCYGMIDGLPITLANKDSGIFSDASHFPILLRDNGSVERCSDRAYIGKLHKATTDAFFTLIKEETIHIELTAAAALAQGIGTNKKQHSVCAFARIYGPDASDELFEDVAKFLDHYKFYLQDPFGCTHNVPYVNPHSLAHKFEQPVMTFDLQQSWQFNTTVSESSELLKALESGDTDSMPEAAQPAAIKTELCRHQKQALKFFLHRETHNPENHIWQPKIAPDGSKVYVNAVTGREHRKYTQLSTWKGGILADEMGLGKTLQMISLVAAGKEIQVQPRRYIPASAEHFSWVLSMKYATLVVAPPNVLSVWEYQLKSHVHTGHLTWAKHHGQNKFLAKSNKAAACPDIILTTYQTVESEFRKYKKKSRTGRSLFDVQWARIILDEAHVIRNLNATSTAIAALEATYRWAVTGTPIQNGLSDLAGLLQCLHFQPYDCPKAFDTDIVDFFRGKNSKSGNDNIEEGVRRLKALSQHILLRRPKKVVELPSRTDIVRKVQFSQEELEAYRQIEMEASGISWSWCAQEHREIPVRRNKLELITKLRMFCNVGLAINVNAVTSSTLTITNNASNRLPSPADTDVESESADAAAVSDMVLGGGVCAGCEQVTGAFDKQDASGKVEAEMAQVYYSECNLVYCHACVVLHSDNASTKCTCTVGSGSWPCTVKAMSSELDLVRKGIEEPFTEDQLDTGIFSSKVCALVEGISFSLPEKSVVLSFWITSLRVVERALATANIRFVRIDSSVEPKDRQSILDQFRADDSIKVLLITMAIGGVGLDLTAASRLHLLEPQWNPAVEDQALARIHRMGQLKPVIITRYITANSIEESVANVKTKKRKLAGFLLRERKDTGPERSI